MQQPKYRRCLKCKPRFDLLKMQDMKWFECVIQVWAKRMGGGGFWIMAISAFFNEGNFHHLHRDVHLYHLNHQWPVENEWKIQLLIKFSIRSQCWREPDWMRRRHGENYFASCFCIVAICLIVHKHTTLWQLTPCNNQFILLLQLDSERSSPPKLIWPTSAWESESSTVLLVGQLFFSKNTGKVTDYAIILQKWHNNMFLATLVALHFTPVSKSVSQWAEFRTSVASRLASLFFNFLLS